MSGPYRDSGQVHRFRDCVAVSVGTGPTRYLSPREARAFARAINRAARSVDREPFAQSSGLTATIGINGGYTRLARGPDGQALRPYRADGEAGQ